MTASSGDNFPVQVHMHAVQAAREHIYCCGDRDDSTIIFKSIDEDNKLPEEKSKHNIYL